MQVPRLAASLLVAFLAAGCAAPGDVPSPAPGPPEADPAPAAAATAGPPVEPGPQPPASTPDPPARPPPRKWADPDQAAIRPGVQMRTNGNQCTSNFVFTSLDNSSVYLGYAAHCAADGTPCFGDDGMVVTVCGGECVATDYAPFPLGTEVEVEGADHPAVLAYSSWGAMGAANETDLGTCLGNDFALVQLHGDDAANVSPALLGFGGPTGLADSGKAAAGDKVLAYGNSELRASAPQSSPKEGYVVGPENGGWSTRVYTALPGIPGDSGSGVLLADGTALGVLATLQYAPLAGSNAIVNLDHALSYARSHGAHVQLATWDLLDGGLLPAPP